MWLRNQQIKNSVLVSAIENELINLSKEEVIMTKILLVIGLFFANTISWAAPNGVMLTCRAGGVHVYGIRSPNIAYVTFKKGTKPVSEGLDKGYCSWADRGFRADEPSSICVSVPSFNMSAGANAQQPFALYEMKFNGAENRFLNLWKTDGLYKYLVNNDGKGCLVIADLYFPKP